MTAIFCDANVVVKWFHPEGEPQAAEAIRIAEADLELRVLNLTYFEVGNALTGKKGIGARTVASVLRQIPAITGLPVEPTLEEFALTAGFVHRYGLTFYDASYLAVSLARGGVLATMDSALLGAGAGKTPALLCEQLGI